MDWILFREVKITTTVEPVCKQSSSSGFRIVCIASWIGWLFLCIPSPLHLCLVIGGRWGYKEPCWVIKRKLILSSTLFREEAESSFLEVAHLFLSKGVLTTWWELRVVGRVEFLVVFQPCLIASSAFFYTTEWAIS